MRAKLINEKFTQDSDPIRDLGIGNPEKSLFPILKKELSKYDIDITWDDDFNMGEGFYDINVEFNLDEEYDVQEIEVQMSYATETAIKDSEEEDWESGFGIYNEDGDKQLIDYTHDIDKVVKVLVKQKFGSKTQVLQKTRMLQKELQKLQNALKVL